MFNSIEFGSFWFFIIIFFVIAVSNAKAQKKKGKGPAPKNPAPTAKPVPVKRDPAAPSQKSSLLSSTMEDRKHDWLAKQLAEERAILRRGIQSDIGAVHDLSCDARKLKIEHEIIHSEINRNNTPYS